MARLGNVRDFELLKFLGKGTFGAVYQARRQEDKKVYAIKKVDTRRMPHKERAESVNEIRVLASISGPHVITFYEAFVDADILYIVTEFATHGDMLGYLKNAKRKGQLPEATVWSLFIQMCLGVQSLHDKNILHRDLKAANVFMFSNSYLKLGDFGVSKVLKTDQALASTQVGTPYYVAPEVWRNKPYNNKCDMWSLGCLLYELCTYRPPFEAGSMEALARTILRGKYEQIPAMYSKGLRDCVARLLVVEPARRASVQEILSMECVNARIDQLPRAPDANTAPSPEAVDIVRTIQVPRRFNDLTKALPASRYDAPPPAPVLGELAPPPGMPRRPPPPPASYGGPAAALKPVPEAPVDKENAHANVAHQQQQQQAPRTKLPLIPGAKQAQGAVQQPYQDAHHRQQHPQQPQQRALAPSYSQQSVQSGAPPQRQRVGAPGQPLRHDPAQSRAQPVDQRYVAGPGGPSREIRMVYHNPHGGSRVSIFRATPSEASYYNPITHQRTAYRNVQHGAQPGSHYHMRHQQQPYVVQQSQGQRRRMNAGGWY